LRTDYRRQRDDPRDEADPAYPLDVGVASDVPIDAQPFVATSDTDVQAFLGAIFPRLEAREIARERRQADRRPGFTPAWLGPISRAKQKAVVRQRVWTHAAAVSGSRVYFGRLERTYRDDAGF